MDFIFRVCQQLWMPQRTRELTIGERHAAFLQLSMSLDATKPSGLRWGTITRMAKLFDVDKGTMPHFWWEIQMLMESGNHIIDEVMQDVGFIKSMKENCGRRLKYNRKALKENLVLIPLKQRRNYRVLSAALGVPKTTLVWMVHDEKIMKHHLSTVKPVVNEDNKVSCLLYCLEEVFPVTNNEGNYFYKNLFDHIDIEEKWFYMTKTKENYFLACGDHNDSDEEVPIRRTRNRTYVGKELFLCAQARPRWDPHRNANWEGKLGIWPVGTFWMRTRGPQTGTLVWEDYTIT